MATQVLDVHATAYCVATCEQGSLVRCWSQASQAPPTANDLGLKFTEVIKLVRSPTGPFNWLLLEVWLSMHETHTRPNARRSRRA